MTPMAAMSPGLNFLTALPSGRDAADNLVTRHHGIDGVAPLVAGHVQVGVADAAVEDLDGDIGGAGFAAGEAERSKRGFVSRRGIAFG